MSRLAAVKNLIAGPLANAKAVRKLIPLFQSIVANSYLHSTQKTFLKQSLPSPGASQ